MSNDINSAPDNEVAVSETRGEQTAQEPMETVTLQDLIREQAASYATRAQIAHGLPQRQRRVIFEAFLRGALAVEGLLRAAAGANSKPEETETNTKEKENELTRA